MTITRQFETQSSHAAFMETLPKALDNKPFEVTDNNVIVFDGARKIKITVSKKPIRELGSLNLPMESATFEFENYSNEEVDQIMHNYKTHTLRGGGG